MRFTTEEGEEIREITAERLRQVLAEDAFGKFALLEPNEHEFIQAGCDWQPTKEARDFLAKHDSDPWLLEARDRRAQFRVTRHVTLDEVIKAFTAYLERRSTWQEDFEWALVEDSVRAGSPYLPQPTAKDNKSTKPPRKRGPTSKIAATKKTVAAKKAVATKKTVPTKKTVVAPRPAKKTTRGR